MKNNEKFFIFGGINFDLTPQKLSSPIIDYLQIIENNPFSSIIIKPTCATPNLLTAIDHIFTNNKESNLTLVDLTNVISDYFLIFCNVQNPCFTMITFTNKYIYWNIHSIERTSFCNDLNLSLTSLLSDLYKSPVTTTSYQNNFEKLGLVISNEIE